MLVSIKDLREKGQRKIRKEDSIIMRHFVRRFSVYFTWFFMLFNASPSFVTFWVLVTTWIPGILFAFPKPIYYLVGALFLQVSYVLDAVDGEIARYRQIDSINGKYLDCLYNYFGFPIVFFGIGFGLYQYFGNVLWVVSGFIVGLSFLLIDVVRITRFEVVFELVRKSVKAGTHFKEASEDEGDIIKLKKYDSLPKKLFYYYNTIFNFRGFSYLFLTATVVGLFFNEVFYFYGALMIWYTITLPLIVTARTYFEYKKGLERFLPYLRIKE